MSVLKWRNKKEEPLDLSVDDLKKQLASATTEMNELIEALNNVLWLRNDWKRFLFYNIMTGILRGLGMAVGSTVVFAIVLILLSRVIDMNLPLISDWLSVFIDMVEKKRGILQ